MMDVTTQSPTGLKTFVRLFPVVTGVIAAISIGTGLYFGQFAAVVPPSPIAVTGSTQTAIWEVNTPGDFTYDAIQLGFTSTRAELQRRPHWWDTQYQYRIPLTITTGAVPATAGNTVVSRISTGFYVSFGALRSDRNDLRVVYWDGATNTELNRDYVAQDDVRFALQANMPATSSSAAYYVYLGNPTAGAPPTDLTRVYEYSSDFSADVFSEPFPWQAYCGLQPAPFSVSSGVLRHSVSTPSDCFAYKPFLLPATSDWYVESKIRINAGTQPVVGSLHLHDSADTLATPNGDGYWMGIVDNASDSIFVRNKLNTFAPTPASATVTPGTTYRVTMKYDYVSPTSRLFNGWLDGVQVINAANDSNANFASGNAYAGVHVYQNGATLADVAWDDFRVWADLGETITIPNPNYLEGQYFIGAPTLELKSGRGLRYGTLTAFSTVGVYPNELGFILTPDDGSTWLYPDFNTLTWVPSNGTYAQSTRADLVNAFLAIAPFPQNGTLRWRALFSTQNPGVTQTALDQVAVTFAPDTRDLDSDGYMNAAAGGGDCVDTLTSRYIDGTPSCSSTAPPTTLDLTVPIVDHAWVQDDAGTYHLFFQNNVEPWSILHYTTTDLQSLTLVGTALTRGSGAGDFDRDGMWAPHVIRKDGTYYMFYTGVTGPGSNPSAPQTIGLATSTNLTTWTKVAANNCSGTTGNGCVYDCRAAWTDYGNGRAYGDSCRDPMVIFDPAQGTWVLFMSTRLTQGGAATSDGISVATSTNLTNWTSAGYIRATRTLSAGEGGVGNQLTGDIAENAFVTQYNGTYYLLFNDWRDPEPTTQYATSTSLRADANGSANWTYRSGIPDVGVNAVKVTVLNNDTWLMSQSVNTDYLQLKRVVWGPGTTFTTANLTKLACRVGSDTIHPAAAEQCGDGIDNNCSGQADEPALCAACVDADRDGYGAVASPACPYPQADCDDTRSNVYPGATETCNQLDDDCDAPVDEEGVCTLPPLACTPRWSCGPWSVCADSRQTRSCTDDYRCGVDTDKPATSRACQVEPLATCAEDWRCADWTVCVAGRRTRTCTDENRCDSTRTRPALEEICPVGGEPTERLIAVAPNRGRPPQIRLLTATGQRLVQFLAYGREFGRSGATVALGDIDGDGRADVVTGTPPGSRPWLRLFDQDGRVRHQFHPYPPSMRSGVTVAAGDFDGDGVAEVAVAPGRSGAPTVTLYRYDPSRPWFVKTASVRAVPRSTGRSVSLAAGDVDGDGVDELLVSEQGRTTPRVFVYDYLPTTARFTLKTSFLAFPGQHRLGLRLAAGDVDGDGSDEIIASSGPGGPAKLRIFDGRGHLVGQFTAAGRTFTGGANPAALDVDGDGQEEVLTVSARSGLPNVFVFSRTSSNRYVRSQSFPAFPHQYRTGLQIDTAH